MFTETIIIMVSNLGLVVLVTMERSLHQPMYLLFCNMSINDAFGATTIITRLLSEVFTPATSLAKTRKTADNCS